MNVKLDIYSARNNYINTISDYTHVILFYHKATSV